MNIQGKENPGYSPGQEAVYWKSTGNGVGFNNKQRGGVPAVLKTLLAILVFCVLVMVALVIAVVLMQHEVREIRAQTHSSSEETNDESKPVANSNVCLTKECVNAAANILSNIDESVHPCDDLYDFACGSWLKSRVIPGDKSSISTFGELDDVIATTVKAIIQSMDQSEEALKAKNLYESCVNTEVLNSRGDQVFKDFIEEKVGDWPLLTGMFDQSTFDLTDLLVRVMRCGLSPFLAFGVNPDNKNPDINILKIDQPDFGMPGMKYYLVPRNDTMLMAYEDYIYNVVNELGAADPSTLRHEVKDIVDFEIALAQISVPPEDRRDSEKLYNPMTLSELHGNYSQEYVDWTRLFRTLASPPDIGITDLGDDERIINTSPQYFNNYTDVLRATSNRTLVNYVFWRVAQLYTPYLTDTYREFKQKYAESLLGTKSVRPRELTCATFTGETMSDLVGRVFVEKHFDSDAKSEALDMISRLQSAFDELVSESDWMDEETKAAAIDKNKHIKSKIGFADRILNDTYLTETYSNITFLSGQFFENCYGVKNWHFGNMMRRLRQAVDKETWKMSPQTVNAYYSFSRNEIVFPAGILQPPFFSKHFPKSLNYGGMGMVIGHEITHGFDDRGRQYDKSGQLTQWWSDDAIAKFKAKAQCIVEQYGNFTYDEAGLNVNGINTQGENIADNGGIKQSFRAYRNWVKEHGQEEKSLPGLEHYSHNQLFFIAQAQVWCGLRRKGSAISAIRVGVHSPWRFRVNGPAQNSPHFAEAFNCPSSSYMNPSKKCEVW